MRKGRNKHKNLTIAKEFIKAVKNRRQKLRQRIVYVMPQKLVRDIRENLPKAAERAAEIPKAATIQKSDVIDKLNTLITSAFGLVAALAWNTAIQKWFESYPQFKAFGPWVYAITVTIVAVIATVWLGRINTAMKKKEEQKNSATR